jgi:hypothetical protein
MLIGELGVAIVLAGGTLAYLVYSNNRPSLQKTAGVFTDCWVRLPRRRHLQRRRRASAVTTSGAVP